MVHRTCSGARLALLVVTVCLLAAGAVAGEAVTPSAPDSAASGGHDGYDLSAADGLSKADILWYNTTTYDLATWIMNGATLVKSVIFANLPSTLGWQLAGLGDFDRNGVKDLLWYNINTGDIVIWFMARGELRERVVVGNVDPLTTWRIVGVGDFDGDGDADILWRNLTTQDVGMWLMYRATIVSAHFVATISNLWHGLPIGIGDFDGDGDDDILWISTVIGDVALWLTNGPTITQADVIVTGVAASWNPYGVGDFNNDGVDDVLWRNVGTGEVVVWFMNGLAFPLPLLIPPTVTAAWEIRGVGDFDGDGDPDVLWQNTSTGDVAVWIMDGPVLVGGFIVGNVPLSASWEILGVGDFNGSKHHSW